MKALSKKAVKQGRPAKIVQDTVQDVPDVPLKALILGVCNNPTWVRGRIDGFSVNVKCPAQVSRRLLGKEVSVTLVHSDLGDYYQYIA